MTTPPSSPRDDATKPMGEGASPTIRDAGPGATGVPGTVSDAVIGPYTVLGLLGEGGFGLVYLGERTEPIRQRVAIKVIKPGLDSAQVLARFDLERRALAAMDHPHVARVLDAGTTPSGRPYFIMEHVGGSAIDDYCDRRRLGVRERLALMGQVCGAVQHAHSKGIIHRDLKPSNILVDEVDGAPVAKVIDFGIAKAVQPEAASARAFTLQGMLIGTPEYMSPEQAGGELDIDTRTDVYSLGVVLYELLTGVLPFEPERLRSMALAEIQRVIREVEPPMPSARLSSLGAQAEPLAAERRTRSATLASELRRELEWIPLKAMRKDRSRRYATAEELREDLARYLAGEPLKAGPESGVYRARKFVARHRAGVAGGALAVASVLGGAGAAVWFGVRERAARVEATTQRDVAESVGGFLNDDLLGSIDPEREDPDVRVVDVLDRAAAKIGTRLGDKPAVRARVLRTLGQSYLNIGRPAQARPMLEEALKLADSGGLLSPDDRDLVVLALSECHWRQLETDAALAVLSPAVDARRSRLGPGVPGDALLGELLNGLGGMHKWAGRYDDAERAYGEALGIRTRVLPPDDPDTLITTYNLAGVEEARTRAALFAAYAAKDEPAQAAMKSQMLAARERMLGVATRCEAALGPDAPTTLAARCEVAYMTNLSGDYANGIEQYRALLPRLRQHLSARHWRTLEASANLSDAYRRTGRHAEAAAELTGLVELYREVRGADFGDTITVTEWLAECLENSGQGAAAGAALERAYADLKAGGAEAADLREFATEIAELYGRLHRAEDEQRWRKSAAGP